MINRFDSTPEHESSSSPIEREVHEDHPRKTHMLVLGSSGEGKSKFLERLIAQDQEDEGVKVCHTNS
jgi:type IV secretory pathway VirB4 component